jgi:hypothetical protein
MGHLYPWILQLAGRRWYYVHVFKQGSKVHPYQDPSVVPTKITFMDMEDDC